MQYPADNLEPRTRTRQRGTSLVEVLVVLVILVLGIFSIARLFPGGFFTIRSTENNTFADRLAQSQLETLKQNSAFLLNGVYAYNDQTMALDPNVNLADLNNDYPVAATPEAAYNDINKARYISGENFTVPASGPNGVPIHVLNYGPVHIPGSVRNGDVPSAFLPGFGLVSAPWTAEVGSSQNDPGDLGQKVNVPGDLLQPGKPNYLVDNVNGQIAVPKADYAQSFTLVVRTPGASGGTYIVPLVVPASSSSNPSAPNSATVYNGDWFSPTVYENTSALPTGTAALPPGATFVPGSVILDRPLTFINTNGGQDTLSTPQKYPNLTSQLDPYTYELAAGASASLGGDVYMGSLAINPRLAGQQVSASYNTVDWHIIHEDVDVPAINSVFSGGTSVTNAPIRLTLNHLRRVGDVLPDKTVSQGLFFDPALPPPPTPYDIVLMDTDTGQMQPLSATDVGSNGAVSDSDNDATVPLMGQFAVSYLNGRITLPAQTLVSVSPATNAWVSAPMPHQHLRVFYAGDYGWAVALQKSPSLYGRDDAGLTTPANGLNYSLPAGKYAVDVVNKAIYFPLSDIGQSVELDDVTYSDTAGKVYQTGSVTLSISNVSDPAYPDQRDVNGHTISGVRPAGDLSANLATALTVDPSATLDTSKGIQIGAVRGISARAVVIWKERDQWKTRSISTILNRS